MNKVLGELEVKLGEETFVLKPTFEGLIEMEARAGFTIAGLLNRFLMGSAGIKDVTAVIYGGIFGSSDGKPELTFNELGEKVLTHGMRNLLQPCAKFIGAAYSGKSMDEIDASKAEEAQKKKGREQRK